MCISSFNDSSAFSIIDLTDGEQAHSDVPLDIAAHRKPGIFANYPPAPTKFIRSSVCQAKPIAKKVDSRCIKAMRRHTCEQIYDSELCPVNSDREQEDLWALLDGMFIQ